MYNVLLLIVLLIILTSFLWINYCKKCQYNIILKAIIDLGKKATETNIAEKTDINRAKLIPLLSELMYNQQLIKQIDLKNHVICLTKAGEEWLNLPDEEESEPKIVPTFPAEQFQKK